MTTKSDTGISFTGLLTIAFIVLKLTGYISWSWWWVLSPIWIPTIIALAILLVIFSVSVTLSWKTKIRK